jgi:integrase
MRTVSSKSEAQQKSRRNTRRKGIRKHGSGYQARVQVNGQAVTGTFPTRAEAEIWLQLKRGELLSDAGGGYEIARNMTVADLLRKYAEKGLTEHLGAVQETSRLHCLAALEWSQTDLLDLLPADINDLMDQFKVAGPRGQPLSADTRRLYFAALSSSFNYAIHALKWHFLANPCAAANRPPRGKGRSRILTVDEEVRIVDRLKASPSPYYLYVVLLLVATTMRMGELFSLRWRDVDLENQEAILQADKANGIQGRTVPLSLEAVALLEAMPREKGDGRLLPIKRSAFVSLWNQLRIDLQIENLRLQDLRHDGATRWAMRLPTLALVQNVTGHKTMAMLQRYVNVPVKDTINAMNAAMTDDPYLPKKAKPAPKPRHSLVQYVIPQPEPSAAVACLAQDDSKAAASHNDQTH